MKYRLFSRLVIANLLFAILFMAGCAGESTDKSQSGKSVSRIILAADKGVVTDPGDQAEPAIAYDSTTQTFLTVFTSINSVTGNSEIWGSVCAGYPKAGNTTATPPTYAYNNYSASATAADMACGAKFQISTTSNGNKTQPKVAYDRINDKYLVAWTDARNGTYSLIYGQFVKTNPDFKTDRTTLSGVLDGANFPISVYIPGAYTSQSQPDVIYNSVTGKFIVAWVDTSTFDNNRILAQSQQKPFWKSGDVFQVTGNSAITAVQVSWSDGSGVLTAGTDYSIIMSGNVATITLTSNPPSSKSSKTLTIAVTSTTSTPSVTKSPRWRDTDTISIPTYSGGGGEFNLVYAYITEQVTSKVYTGITADSVIELTDQKYYLPGGGGASFPNGTEVGTETLISLENSNAVGTSNPITVNRTINDLVFVPMNGTGCINSTWPGVYVPASLTDNNRVVKAEIDGSIAAATYISQNMGNNLTDVSEILFTSNISATATNISAAWSAQVNESRPKITYNSTTGENYIAWSGINRDINMNLAVTRVMFGSTPVPDLCVYDSGGTYSIVSADAALKIKLRRNPGLGLVKDYSFGSAAASYPALATDPNTNRLLLAWEDNQSIFGQLVELTSFTSYGPSILISSKSTTAGINDPRTSPVVAFDNVNQRFLTVWEDARNQSSNISNVDVYGQFIDPQGNLSGGNTLVTVASGNQLAPTIAFGDINYRKFFVNWKDGSNPSDSNIFGQLHEYSLGPQLSLFTKDAAGQESPLLNGALDFGSINVGLTIDKILVLRNDGNSQLIVNSISEPDSPYSFLTPKPVSINPNTSYELGLRFSPYAAGSYSDPTKNFKITIDSTGGKAVVYFSAAGTGFNPLSITTSYLPDASTGSVYNVPIIGSGGVYPYLWEINCKTAAGDALPKNTLPAGLSFNTLTGAISGTPFGVIGEYSITVTLMDNSSPKGSLSRTYTLKIGNLSIATTSLKTWGLMQNYSGAGQLLQVSANGQVSTDVNAYKWEQAILGSLPSGMHFSFASGYDAVGSDPNTWTGGKLIGTPALSGSFTFLLMATDRLNPTLFAQREFTLTINPTPAILTSSLPVGIIGKPYSYAISMTGGTAPFTWGVKSGTSLPSGLSFSNGVISGIPTASNTIENNKIEITLADATGYKTSAQLSLSINNALDILTSTDVTNKWSATNPTGSPTDATAGSYYSFTLLASGGIAPYTWAVTAGALPPGLSLQTNSGGISGTPATTTPGTYLFNLQVTDTTGNAVTKLYTLKIAKPLNVTTAALKPWTINIGNYSQQMTADGGTSPYTWYMEGGVIGIDAQNNMVINKNNLLPTGLSLDPTTGLISGTPSVKGNFPIVFTLTDSNNAVTYRGMDILINDAMTITTTTLASGADGVLYNQQLVMTGGTAPYNWTVTAGALPDNLTLDPISGLISGIPATASTTATTFNFTVTATDNTQTKDAAGVTISGATVSKNLSITISPLLTISTATPMQQVAVNAAYNQALAATGGRIPYTWSIDSGTLPTGLSLATATGLITGTATAPGTYNFIVKVTDADAVTVTKTLSITVGGSGTGTPPAALTITTTSLQSGNVNSAYTSTTLLATGGTKPYSWTVINGTLPTGMGLASATGVISGTPTVGGNYDMTVQVMDNDLKSSTQTLSIVVLDPTIPGALVKFTDGTSQINSLAYGNAYKGTSTKKTVTIANNTASPVSITSIASSSTAFAVSAIPFEIAASGSVSLDITFTPASVQAYSGVITLTDINGSKYQLPVTGSGIGVNAVLGSGAGYATGTMNYFNSLTTTSLPTGGKPADFVAMAVADFQVTNVKTNGVAGGTIKVSVTFANMPANPVFYKLDANNNWVKITGATVSGDVVTFDVLDNGPLDSNSTLGIIQDPVIVGITSTSGSTNTAPAVSGGKGGGGCFIATAAYGSYLDPHVMVLRHFRDDVLLQSELGTAFVKFYYKHSPPVADFIARHDALRVMMRLALTPLIFAVKYPLVVTLLSVLAGAWFIRRRLVVKEQF